MNFSFSEVDRVEKSNFKIALFQRSSLTISTNGKISFNRSPFNSSALISLEVFY